MLKRLLLDLLLVFSLLGAATAGSYAYFYVVGFYNAAVRADQTFMWLGSPVEGSKKNRAQLIDELIQKHLQEE